MTTILSLCILKFFYFLLRILIVISTYDENLSYEPFLDIQFSDVKYFPMAVQPVSGTLYLAEFSLCTHQTISHSFNHRSALIMNLTTIASHISENIQYLFLGLTYFT